MSLLFKPLSHRRDCKASLFSSDWTGLFLILFIAGAVIIAASLRSPVSLGDEVHHYRFAKNCFLQKDRALFDSLYSAMERPAIFYVTDPAWPVSLSWVWRLLGRVSLAAAQFYHLGFYLLLVISTYFWTRRLYSREQAWWSALLVATTPMVVSFSVLFYTDMPATALVALSFWLLSERRFFWAGLATGIAFLMKKTTIFFIPASLFYFIYYYRSKISKSFGDLTAFGVPFALIILSEFVWRMRHFPAGFDFGHELKMRMDVIYGDSSAGSVGRESGEAAVAMLARAFNPLKNNEFANSHILNVLDQCKYFGIALIVGFGLYLIRKRISARDLWLWVAVMVYTSAIVFLRILPDIRYFMPAVPFLCILAAKPLAESSGRIFRGAIVGLCILQLLSTSVYTGFKRQLSEGIQEGFQFIRERTPPDALILYPELNILEHAERRIVWGLFPIRSLFWGAEPEKLQALKKVHLNYIAIKKSRIYKDTAGNRHIGGYPQSFLDHMTQWPFVERVFENGEMTVWEIKPDLLEQAYAASYGKGRYA